MNRQKVIEIIKGELSRVHSGIKVIHDVTERDNIDVFMLINENIYLAIPVVDMDEKINKYSDPIPHIMLEIMFRLMEFMEKISK